MASVNVTPYCLTSSIVCDPPISVFQSVSPCLYIIIIIIIIIIIMAGMAVFYVAGYLINDGHGECGREVLGGSVKTVDLEVIGRMETDVFHMSGWTSM